MRDLRLALRQLWKARGFSLIIVLTLTLGIGATTAIFSLIEGVLLRPLPFHDPQRLVILGDHLGDGLQLGVTAPEVATYQHSARAFSSMGGYTTTSWELSGGPLSQSVNGARLTASVFPTLGVAPIIGRVFTQQEDDARSCCCHQLLAVAESLSSRPAHRGRNDHSRPKELHHYWRHAARLRISPAARPCRPGAAVGADEFHRR